MLIISSLQLVDPKGVHDELFVERLALTFFDLADEVGLEAGFRHVDPAALGRPVHIARRYLRLRHKRNAAIAEISETYGVPRRFGIRRLM